MTRLLMSLIGDAVILVMGALAQASPTAISFLYVDSFAGVDGDTSGWSTDDDVAVFSTNSWSLLSGMASVDGYININDYGILTHRGRRGLGVKGQENDEVDSHERPERIEITFNIDHFINSIEVRSLFSPDNRPTFHTEYGAVDFMRDGLTLGTTIFVGSEPLYAPGTRGVASMTYGSPYLVDKLTFYVPTIDDSGNDLSCTIIKESEFAVAKLDVTPIPAPGAILLSGIGVGLVSWLRRRRTL